MHFWGTPHDYGPPHIHPYPTLSPCPPPSPRSTAPSHPAGSSADHGPLPPAGPVVPCRRRGRHKPLGLRQPQKRPEDHENTRTTNQNYTNPQQISKVSTFPPSHVVINCLTLLSYLFQGYHSGPTSFSGL